MCSAQFKGKVSQKRLLVSDSRRRTASGKREPKRGNLNVGLPQGTYTRHCSAPATCTEAFNFNYN
jgi:hypothetical protein